MSTIKDLGSKILPPTDHQAPAKVDVPTLAQPLPPVDASHAEAQAFLNRSLYDPSQQPNTDAAVRGKGLPFEKPVQDLVPDLSRLKTLPDVKDRFNSDYKLMRDQVVGLQPDGTDKANRAFEFFSAYASRFVVVATGESQENAPSKDTAPTENAGAEVLDGKLWNENLQPRSTQIMMAPPVDPKEATAQAQSFAESLRQLGFAAMRETRSGKNGVELAKEILGADSLQDMRNKLQPPKQMEASGDWPPEEPDHPPPGQLLAGEDVPEAHFGAESYGPTMRDLGESPAELSYNRIQVDGIKAPPPWQIDASKVVIQAPPRLDGVNDIETRAKKGRSTDKRLGPRMLWNVLHTYRGTGEDSVLAQDEKSRLAWIALLLLGMAAIVVIVLVSL